MDDTDLGEGSDDNVLHIKRGLGLLAWTDNLQGNRHSTRLPDRLTGWLTCKSIIWFLRWLIFQMMIEKIIIQWNEREAR